MFVVYGKDGCTFCDKAKALLESKNLQYVYKQLGEDFILEDLLALAKDAKTFPQIFEIEGNSMTLVGGFTELSQKLSGVQKNG